jgi:hypothetical protein
MGFGIFEGIWRTITGTVVWTKDVDLKDGTKISFRLKNKDGKSYVVMAFRNSGAHLYYPMDLRDLQELEEALLATRNALDTSKLQALAREKEAELMRLGILDRIWRWVIDTPLWKEDVIFGTGAKISFRIRRKVDKHAEIVFRSGEETHYLRMDFRELEILEDALLATEAAIEKSRSSG